MDIKKEKLLVSFQSKVYIFWKKMDMEKEKEFIFKEKFGQKFFKKILEEKENKSFKLKKEKIDYWREKLKIADEQ